MNKIYNNLTVDNLIKTEWFNQFNKSQQKEIRLGLEEGLNISWYAKPEFNRHQMRQIITGLEDKLDVSIYAKPELSFREMETIREKLWEKSTQL